MRLVQRKTEGPDGGDEKKTPLFPALQKGLINPRRKSRLDLLLMGQKHLRKRSSSQWESVFEQELQSADFEAEDTRIRDFPCRVSIASMIHQYLNAGELKWTGFTDRGIS